MTLLLAAFLGNGLAWGIHTLAWWLRKRSIFIVGVLGLCAAVFFYYFVLLYVGFTIFSGSEGGLWRFDWRNVPDSVPGVGVGLVPIFIGWIHVRYLKKKKPELFIYSAVYFEIALVPLTYPIIASIFGSTFDETFYVTMMLSLQLTLFVLAFIRPQVVKVQKWLWHTVLLQRAADPNIQ